MLNPDAEYFVIKITWGRRAETQGGRGGAKKLGLRPWEELYRDHIPDTLFLHTCVVLTLPSLLMDLVFIEQSELREIQRS